MCRRGRYNLCEVARTRGKAYKLYGHSAPGAFAEYAARPAPLLHKIPDNVTFEESTIVNQGAMGLHAIRRSRIEPGDTVAVLGPGLVGLIVTQLAKATGATRVIMVGRGERLNLARELGADEVIDYTSGDSIAAIRNLTGGRGVDCCFECAGTPSAISTAINVVRRGGRVALVGLTGNKPVELNTDRLVLDEIDLFGVRSSPNAYPELLKLISAGQVNVQKLVSRVYPLDQIQEAFKAFEKREGGAVRMVIKLCTLTEAIFFLKCCSNIEFRLFLAWQAVKPCRSMMGSVLARIASAISLCVMNAAPLMRPMVMRASQVE